MDEVTAWPIDEWETAMQNRWSPRTIAQRRWVLQRFARSHPDPWAVRPRDVEAVLGSWGSTTNYQRFLVASLHSFYVWAIRAELTERDPTVALPPIRPPKRKAKPCPDPVIRAAILRSDAETALMIRLMAGCGLRCAETAAVHTDCIDGDMLTVRGKGDKERVVALNDRLQADLSYYEGFVFPGRFEEHMRPASVGHRVKLALAHPRFSAHSLRHRFATKGYRASNNDLLLVQEAMGHASPVQTKDYIEVDFAGLRRIAAALAI